MKQEVKNPELKKLVKLAEKVSDLMNQEKNPDQGFMLVTNSGQAATTAIVGTGPCLSSALYTSCKASDELTMIVLTVAAELVHSNIKERDNGYNPSLMGPKGDA
jgi:hypothetical protein